MKTLSAHGHLNHSVQLTQRDAARHLHAPPGHGADTVEPDLELHDGVCINRPNAVRRPRFTRAPHADRVSLWNCHPTTLCALLTPLANAAASPHTFSEPQAPRHAHAPGIGARDGHGPSFMGARAPTMLMRLLNLPLLGGICLKDDPRLALAEASGSRGNEHWKAGCEPHTSLTVC